jgi:psp operon transcriptional activator
MYRHGTSEFQLDDIILNPFAKSSPMQETSLNAESPAALPDLPLDLKLWMNEQEKQLIDQALRQARFNQRKAADLLALTYHQLRGMLKKHGIQVNAQEGD